LRLELGYDGTAFAGWAVQPGQRTVAGELTRALEVVAHAPVALTVAGRTDAGVHARAQVAHVDVAASAASHITVRGLNGLLPPDVRIRSVAPAAPGFDARFSALARVYGYRVTDHPADPLRRLDTLSWPRPLDEQRMQRASARLLGLHDFAAYCRAREGRTSIRELQRLEWVRDGDGVLVATVEADAFCHSMVRSLVGALLPVGDGRWAEERPAGLLASDRRADSVVVAPAHGLTLLGVSYPPDSELAARAALTRAVREPQN
jgi:tRNA pseudouridine38-40 synthase